MDGSYISYSSPINDIQSKVETKFNTLKATQIASNHQLRDPRDSSITKRQTITLMHTKKLKTTI
jgi:hypothetical protein